MNVAVSAIIPEKGASVMASTAFAAADREMSVGRVFQRGFGVLRDNPATVFGVVFLLQALPAFVLGLLRRTILLGAATSGTRCSASS